MLFIGAVASNAYLPWLLSELREMTLLIQIGLYTNQLAGIGFLLAFWRVPFFKRLLTGCAVLVSIVLSALYGFSPPHSRMQPEIVAFVLLWSVCSVGCLWGLFWWIRWNETQKINGYADRLAIELPNDASAVRRDLSDQQRVSLKYILGMMFVIAVSLSLFRGLNVQVDRWITPLTAFVFYCTASAIVTVLLTVPCVLAFASALADDISPWIISQFIYMFVFFIVLPAALSAFNPALFAYCFLGFFFVSDRKLGHRGDYSR